MAVTQNTYTGNGSTVLYSFTFPYLEQTDVKVSLNGVITTQYTFANATTIQFNTAPANGAAIRIYRVTDDANLTAIFYPGAAIRAQDLNDNFTQNLYVTQESTNNANAATSTANTALTNSATAIATANTALSNSSTAVSTANTASSNASAAVATANTASTNASNAVSTANATASALANALLFDIVANVAAIPASPSNNDAVEITDSTGIQSFTPLSGIPGGFIGSSGLSVRLVYSSAGSTWTWLQYFPNDPEARYSRTSDTRNLLTTGTSTAASFIPTSSTAPTNGVYLPSANNIALSTNGTGRLFIDSSGRVGVGTTSPAGLIHGRAAAGAVGLLLDGNTGDSNTSPPVIDFRGNAGTGQGARIAAINTGIGYGRLDLAFFTSNTGSDTYTPAERARIDSSGRLLVGTSSAQGDGRLQVQGSNVQSKLTMWRDNAPFGFIDGTAGSSIEFGASPSSGVFGIGASIQFFGDQTWGSGDYPGRLVFSTTAHGASSPTERMRIDSAGRVGIPAINTGKTLTVDTSTTTDTAAFQHSSASMTGSCVVVATGRAAGTACYFVYGIANSTATFAVTNNGDVRNQNNVYGSISDLKLKENIVDAGSQWSDIKALQVRKYNFKEGQTHTQIGLVAQEVELVSPGLVTETTDRDEEGNDLGTVTKSVNYSVLYMKAVKALQEAMERIETLEAKVAALESA